MGSHETAHRYWEINGRGRELPCLGTRKRKPPARGSGQTHGPAPTREQTETVSPGWGAAGGVRSTKDRDVLALEVRAGTRAVGRTTRDAAGFLAALPETELK